MKNVGIITEYNPFHNGHAYQIERIKSELNPDLIVSVMSQDITQRGEFASFNKWWRAEKALQSGVDLVIGLPYFISSQSAEYFSRGSLKILNEIGINILAFGSESNQIEILENTANTLVTKDQEIKKLIKSFMKNGYNFPKARELALKTFNIDNNEIFKSNNILAVEYLKTIKNNNYSISPLLIKRIGSDYNDLNINNNIASARAIRNSLETGNKLTDCIPYSNIELKREFRSLDREAFFRTLIYKLLNSDLDNLSQIVGINNDRAHQLLNLKTKIKCFEDIYKNLKFKNTTQTAINRMILNLIMDFKKSDFKKLNSQDFIPYLRVLGFNKKGQEVLKHINIPIITTFNKGLKNLDDYQRLSIDYDIKAAQLRSLFLDITEFNNDYLKRIIIK